MDTNTKAKVLRSVFLDPAMDEILRQAAFRLKVSKGELIRTYIERGIQSERQTAKNEHAAAKRAVGPKPEKREYYHLRLSQPVAAQKPKAAAKRSADPMEENGEASRVRV